MLRPRRRLLSMATDLHDPSRRLRTRRRSDSRGGSRWRRLRPIPQGGQLPGFRGAEERSDGMSSGFGSTKPTVGRRLPRGHGRPASARSGPLGRGRPQLCSGCRPLGEAAVRGQVPPTRTSRPTALNGPETPSRFAPRRLHHQALSKHPDADRSPSDLPARRADS
jgi:hypothetical protein